MVSLGETLQLRVKQSLEAEVNFYASRGLITNEEQLLIADTFREAAKVASSALPLELHQRPLVLAPVVEDKSLSEKIEDAVENVMVKLGVKTTYDDSPWSGDASQWKTAESYCASCLIDMNEGSGSKTKDKCKLPYKKEGSGSINVNALRAMASGARGLSAVKGASHDQMIKASNFMIRHWQSAFDKPAPANIYRMAGKKPPEGSKETSASFFKDKAGQWWMLGIYSNRWMDRENEILSEASHEEYAKWVNESGFKPQVVVYHLPHAPKGFWEKVWDQWSSDVAKLNSVTKKFFEKTAIGEVDRIVYLNGFSIAVAKIYPHMYEAAEKLANIPDLGMSHGFLVYGAEDPSDFSSLKDTVNIVSKYRSFEMSVLFRERAANYGTAPLFMEGKSVALTAKDREMLSSVLGDDFVDSLEGNTKASSEVLDTILEHKELADPQEEAKSTPPSEIKAEMPMSEDEEDEEEDMDEEKKDVQPTETQEPVTESKETGTEEVVEQVLKALNLDELKGLLTTIVENQKAQAADIAALKQSKEAVEDEVKSLKQTEDEKIAAKLSPFNWANIGYSASASDKTALPKEQTDKALANGPGNEAPTVTGDKVYDLFWNSAVK